MPEHGATRRQFLKGAALALGAPYVVAPSVLGAAAPSNRLTMGFIGIGKQASGHVGSMLGRPGVQVLAICDVEARRRELTVKRVNDQYASRAPAGSRSGCAGYNDFREIVDRPDIDAVVIGTPDHWHAIPTIQCAQSGKDIYCEKPLSLTLGEARAMVNAVRRHARVFQTGSQQRSWGDFRFACEMVRSGRVGKLHTVHVNVGGPSVECTLPGEPVPEGLDWDMWLGPAPWRPFNATIAPPASFGGWPQWRSFRDYSGGGMTDMGAHHFDIAQWGMGTDDTGPVEIIPPDGKEHKWLTYQYANGVTMYHGGGRSDITFIGTAGEVRVGRGHLSTTPGDMMRAPIGAGEVHLYDSRDHHADWLHAIRTRTRPVADIEIGARSVSVCHLGNLAYLLNRPLRWDPAREQFLGDDEANRLVDRPKRAPWRL